MAKSPKSSKPTPKPPPKPKSHSAVPSALGYYYQGLYSLVLLLKGGDTSAVSVETDDDVVEHAGISSLHQLKHSTGNPAPLTLNDDGFWKTIGIWSAVPLDGSVNCVFVTCAPIATKSELESLTDEESDRTQLLAAMEAEAARVRAARAAAKKANTTLPYAKRAAGCECFLAMKPQQRKKLLSLISIAPKSFNAGGVPAEVEKLIGHLFLPTVRGKLIEHLIEWWDRQVVLSLLKHRPRKLVKSELQQRLHELFIEHSAVSLPDNFSAQDPPAIDKEIGTVMEQQIVWVDGGDGRVKRAALARWRSRKQRQAWLDKNFAAAAELKAYDKKLKEAWQEKFDPMKHDCRAAASDVCCARGLGVLDWSHDKAHQEIRKIRPSWEDPFLVRGSLQQMSEEEEIGWHPDYVNLLVAYKARAAAAKQGKAKAKSKTKPKPKVK